MAELEVRDLRVDYGSIRAVRNVSLTVQVGQVSVILGANGAGKSSTVRAICGLLDQTAGQVTWQGLDISQWPAHRVARSRLALIPEGRRVFAPLTVEENLLLGGYSRKGKRARQETLYRVYETFPPIAERRSGKAGLLSGGEQSMLAFGRAMMADPLLVVADEPSLGLSPAMVDTMMAIVRGLADSGIGVLMVEQNATAALSVADQVSVIERGEVVLHGEVDEVRSDPRVVAAFLGGEPDEVAG